MRQAAQTVKLIDSSKMHTLEEGNHVARDVLIQEGRAMKRRLETLECGELQAVYIALAVQRALSDPSFEVQYGTLSTEQLREFIGDSVSLAHPTPKGWDKVEA